MPDCGKQCYNCKHFERYYVKQMIKFEKTKFGRCCLLGNNVNVHDCCQNYVFKPRTKKINGFIQIQLNDILTELTTLRNILEENSDDNA